MQGPTLPIAEETHASKYRLPEESFEQCVYRIAGALRDGNDHWRAIKDIFGDMRFMPGGRVQNAVGSPRTVTAFNCFVSGVIDDSMSSIMTRAAEASETMRRGGGVGYDFSRLRPRGELISTLGSRSSGPVSFMGIFDAICQTISSAGHRRGAQMGVMRIDHPDIEQFIAVKQRQGMLEGFNVSVGVTDEFIGCLLEGKEFALRWGGKVYSHVDPKALWATIMRSTWDYAEPGVLFIDTINRMNNLAYCETIEATNPCFTGDQKVWTDEGPKTFRELDGKRVKVLTETVAGKLVMRHMDVFKTAENAELIRVTLDDGSSITCTPQHEFFTLNRKKIPAKDMKPGMRIASVYRHNANSKGYKRLTNGMDNPLEHHVPFEIIPEGFHVHHINEVKDDNRYSNLQLIPASEHNSYHMVGDRNPSRTHPERNHFNNGFSGDTNGRWRDDISTERLEGMRKSGMSYKSIAAAIGCSKYTVMNRLGYSRPNHKVVSVEYISTREDVYCGTVDETHKFFLVCENGGILVSNCGEQPLPPNGACLLGSFNLTKYITHNIIDGYDFNWSRFEADIYHVVRAMDNVIDRTIYPLPAQELEAKSKRRMGLGVTGLANVGEIFGYPYGSEEFLSFTDGMLRKLTNYAYLASTELAREKGSFKLYDEKFYPSGNFIQRLDFETQSMISKYGIRNSHLTSIAPTGTISLTADNVSSGIEPPFRLTYERTIQTWDGPTTEEVTDYAYRVFGVKGRTADELTAAEHLSVVAAAQKWVDSAVSKTCNVGPNVSFDEFSKLYLDAWTTGCKGLTTFRANGKRKGILNDKQNKNNQNTNTNTACTFDPETGKRTCDA